MAFVFKLKLWTQTCAYHLYNALCKNVSVSSSVTKETLTVNKEAYTGGQRSQMQPFVHCRGRDSPVVVSLSTDNGQRTVTWKQAEGRRQEAERDHVNARIREFLHIARAMHAFLVQNVGQSPNSVTSLSLGAPRRWWHSPFQLAPSSMTMSAL